MQHSLPWQRRPGSGQQGKPSYDDAQVCNNLEVKKLVESGKPVGSIYLADQTMDDGVNVIDSVLSRSHCHRDTPNDPRFTENGSHVGAWSTTMEDGLIESNTKACETLNSPANSHYLVMSCTTPDGTVINVFDDCIDGSCYCEHYIGGVRSQLKPCRFASIVCDDLNVWSSKHRGLLDGIADGFEIVQGEIPNYECSNYKSILEPGPKSQMNVIVQKELDEGMISEVFSKPHCIHSLGAVPKPGGKIRPITDCSRPSNVSINNYCGSLFREFTYKSVENVVEILNSGDYMGVIDIKSAYRSVPIRAEHRTYMGFRWEVEGKLRTFVDNRLCFGHRLGPCYFNDISSFIYDVLTVRDNVNIVNYLDDFIVVAPSYEDCASGQTKVVNLLRFLGFHVSYEKMTSPCRVTTFLGIEIDSEKMELRLPEAKLEKLRSILDIYKFEEKITKHDLESLGGLLSHCSHVVRGGKIFCRRIYQLYKDMLAKGKKWIRIPAEIRRDIEWWDKFCTHFNGVSKINNQLFEMPMVSDASMKGFAVYLGSDWAAGFWDGSEMNMCDTCNHLTSPPSELVKRRDVNINVLELWPIVLGLQRWSSILSNKSLLLFTDNTQVLYMLLNGKSCNKICMSWIREIFWICIIHNIELLPRYINTECNLVADTLSRLLYFSKVEEITSKLGGSGLCCLENLFDCYRSSGERAEEEIQCLPRKFNISKHQEK